MPMATDVLISEVLCFIRNNFDKLAISELKPTVVNFYNDEELSAAKGILLKAVTTALDNVGSSVELPRIPPRRVGDNKKQHTVDDLLKLFTVIDERRLSMPSFVALDLTRVPFLNADSMGMIAMMRKMESFERRLATMEDWCVQEQISAPHSHLAVQPTGADQVPDEYDSSGFNATPSSETSDEEHGDNDGDRGNPYPWVDVARRHHPTKPRAIPSAARSAQSGSNVKKRSKLLETGRQKLVGTAHSSDPALKPGVDIVRKSVIHIDNLDINCTPELLKDYLLTKDITVLSCYATKSWLRDDEKDKVTAFRLCVATEHRDSVMNASIWSKGIVLRDWKFKGNTVQNKSPRHGAGARS